MIRFLTIVLAVLLMGGAVWAQQVHVFTNDSLPKTLTSPTYDGDTIRISGTRIFTTTNGIDNNGADKVVFDFLTDTLEFGTGGGQNRYGIQLRGQSDSCVIRGGFVIHNIYDTGAVCILLSAGKGNRTVSTHVETIGHSSNLISTPAWPTSYGNVWDSMTWDQECKSFQSRESYNGAAFLDGGPGWPSVGTNGDTAAEEASARDRIIATRFTMPENGYGVTVTPRYGYPTGTTPSPLIKFAIYTLAGALVDSSYTFTTNELTTGATSSTARNIPLMLQANLTSGTTYYLCVWTNNNANLYLKKDPLGGTNMYAQSATFGTWPTTFSPSTITDSVLYCVLNYRQSDYVFGNKIENNNIVECHAQAIINKNVMICRYNTAVIDARNDRWDTAYVDKGLTGSIGQSASNSYFLISRFGQPGTEVAYNTVTSGTTYQGCRGVDIENTWGIPSKKVSYHHNTFNISNGPQSEPADVSGTCRVIRARAIDGGYLAYIDVYENDMTGFVDSSAATKWIGLQTRLLNFGFPANYTADTCKVYNNRFRAKSKSLAFVDAKGSEMVWVAAAAPLAWPHVIQNNKFVSSQYIVGFGDGANTIEASEMVLNGDTLSFLAPADTVGGYVNCTDKYTWQVGLGDLAMDNVAKNNVYLEGASDTNIFFGAGGADNAELGLNRTVTMTVLGNNGYPVPNADVKVRSSYAITGTPKHTGTTDANGKFIPDMTYWYEAEDTIDSTTFNPFRFVAVSGADSASTDYTVSPTNIAVTVTLTGTAGTPPASAVKSFKGTSLKGTKVGGP